MPEVEEVINATLDHHLETSGAPSQSGFSLNLDLAESTKCVHHQLQVHHCSGQLAEYPHMRCHTNSLVVWRTHGEASLKCLYKLGLI